MALLGLGLQQWLSKGPATGLAYISSQVSDEEFVSFPILLILRVHALQSWLTERHCPHFTHFTPAGRNIRTKQSLFSLDLFLRKLGQRNHLTIMTPSISKSSVFEMI